MATDTIKLGSFNIPKPVAIGGVIAAGVTGVYFYRKQSNANSAQQASVDQASTDQIDPATGYPYGSPEDNAALAQQATYQVNGLDTGLSGYGFTGYSGGSGGGVFGTGNPGSFASNAEWAQYVEAYEENNLGADAPTVGNAIGKYLTGQPLTTDQVGLVQSAIAIGGYPPVSGPNGNPPGYVTAGSTPPPPPPNGNPPPGGNPPPTPTGNAKPITGLHEVKHTATSVTVGWDKTFAPQGYSYMLKQVNGKIVKIGQTGGTSVTIGGLHSGWEYNFSIHGIPNGQGNAVHITKL